MRTHHPTHHCLKAHLRNRVNDAAATTAPRASGERMNKGIQHRMNKGSEPGDRMNKGNTA
ncbi:hypothetical protein E2C01_088620 [Portunus trituberculatus]|uniref:Uncharacterized protein n=1 Tax=Portunus trituberculatus TaxID=210409 RepID=A0A5B7J6N9_PORTR|nr:hypothetical protein [Portunus trituberculatus]